MDSKGQLSAEYILMLGFVLLIVLAVAFYAGNENEQNSISSATRSGATNATTALSVTTPGMLPVRVESIEMSGTGNITLLIKLSNKNAQIQNITLTGVYNSLTSQGYSPLKNIDSNEIIQNLNLNTSKHNYTISLA
ncbi:class III signal peptide-containing protein [Methanobacterium formicicum]|jgi:uncharacterized protein (UPF0333 family)|uniref:Class III signal peptide-containing protein n=1 Tax=Methanobacterium formicicum TaxID=2162 RepID=A0A089ZI44_METFO|nr:class III signal peptide-containing protein [Methanobacterium formicicum]AIS32208.1 hypothetical protein BRM9_1393 [Methanobacterium formicicum]MBF4475197.1 class III signal peptide-containing protein [Methanobacterium formicicum]CEL24557.1 putative membrane protein [Methanobacterium formicicum]